MELRDYQRESVDFLVPRRRAMIVAPAGSGKTVIGAAAVGRRAWPGARIIWLANTREQVEQAERAFAHAEGPDCDITVCCVAANPDTARCDILVVDECHHTPAETWDATIERAAAAGAVIWGLTATPWHEDGDRNQRVRDTFREFYTIERERVIASGHLVDGKVFMHDLDREGEFDAEIGRRVAAELRRRCARFSSIPAWEHERRARWQITQELVQANPARNKCAIDLAVQEAEAGESVLMLVYSIEHGQQLAMQIPGAVVCHSKISKKKRAGIIEDFRHGRLPVLVATSLADEGLDVPRASRLVLVAGGRSAGKLEQRAGRVLRPFAGKGGGIIHDFLDRGATFALAQARARMKVYERLGYEPEIFAQSVAA